MIQTPAHGQGKQGKKGNLILNSKKYGKQGKERKPHFEFIGDTDTGPRSKGKKGGKEKRKQKTSF